jgi:hypothetical protein
LQRIVDAGALQRNPADAIAAHKPSPYCSGDGGAKS